MTDPTTDLASLQTANVSPLTDQDSWWAGGDEVEGYDLLKDDALFELVGVPFKGLTATFRDGIQAKGVPYRNDYVTVEARVAPVTIYHAARARIASRRAAMEVTDKPQAMPDEQLVINDGSTGFYRQVLQYLVMKGAVTLPEGNEEGEKNDCIFDLPRSQWLTGADEATAGFDLMAMARGLNCTRGLRFSEYPSEYLPEGEMARTWYIA